MSTFSIDPKPLTLLGGAAILASLFPEMVMTRFQTRQNKTVRPIAPIKVHRFFYASRKCTGLIRTYLSSMMVGYFRGVASVLATSETLILLHRPRIQTLAGGYFIFKTGNHMNTKSQGHKSALQNPLNPFIQTKPCKFPDGQFLYDPEIAKYGKFFVALEGRKGIKRASVYYQHWHEALHESLRLRHVIRQKGLKHITRGYISWQQFDQVGGCDA